MTDLLNMLGALATLVMGLLGLLAPRRAAGFVGLEAVTTAGRSEFRATYGGLFVALGGAALAIGAPLAFAVAGLAWLGAAIGRVLSIFADRAASAKNWAAVAFEVAFAGLLLSGAPLIALL